MICVQTTLAEDTDDEEDTRPGHGLHCCLALLTFILVLMILLSLTLALKFFNYI